MSGNGVSLQPTIVQLGAVAQSQMKGQQTHHPTTPFSERLDATQDAKVQRVRKADEAERKRIDADAERERRRREHPPGEETPEQTAAPADDAAPEAAPEGGEPDIGRLIDTRA
ncbi:MAG: hypothetical protein ACYDIE_05855 [Candidatus Krumholzibacteriia bacterium]